MILSLFLYTLWTFSITAQINENEKIFNYMKRFGYVDPMPEALVTNDQLEEGIRLMQKFAHIPETGVLDEKTRALAKASRCGVKDIPHSNRIEKRSGSKPPYELNGVRWRKRSINYHVLNSTDKLEKSQVETLLQKALQIWQNVSRLNFNKVQERFKADLVFTFFSGVHSSPNIPEKDFDGPGGILAHVSVPEKNLTAPVYIHFDDDEMWVDEFDKEKDCNGIGFFTVATHEVGHVLGLNHNFLYGSIMNPYFNSNNPNVKLTYADALGMHDLYVGGGKFGKSNEVVNPIDYPPNPPDCNGNFDGALAYYDELYLFKGKVVWRIWRNTLFGERSLWIRERFRFPSEIEKIDAVYQRRTDGKVLFFTGNRYWIFDYIYPFTNESLPISTFGFSDNIDSIDAAMVWAEDENTYFFKNNNYWCYNEVLKKMEDGYPRSTRRWKFTRGKLDAVASFRNGTTYFFKEKKYWEIDRKGYLINPRHPYMTERLLKCEFKL